MTAFLDRSAAFEAGQRRIGNKAWNLGVDHWGFAPRGVAIVADVYDALIARAPIRDMIARAGDIDARDAATDATALLSDLSCGNRVANSRL